MTEKQEISYMGFWTIPSVVYRGKTETYRLFKKMTPKMNQKQLSELYEQEKQKGNPCPTDAPLIWAIGTRAYTLKNGNHIEAARLRAFLQQSLKREPNTLTRIIYNPSGEDKIVHNHGTSDEYSIDAHVVGPHNLIDEMSNENILESLLGTQDVVQINKISQWINNINTYIWRSNLKPREKDERVVRFHSDDGRLLLDCCGGPFAECPAFRVLRVD